MNVGQFLIDAQQLIFDLVFRLLSQLLRDLVRSLYFAIEYRTVVRVRRHRRRMLNALRHMAVTSYFNKRYSINLIVTRAIWCLFKNTIQLSCF
jgi:hypothetical protein